MRRSSPGYYFRPRRHIPLAHPIRCICGKTFGSSRELHEHEAKCAQVRHEETLRKRGEKT